MIDVRVLLEIIVNKRQPQNLVLRLTQQNGREATFRGYQPIALEGRRWLSDDGSVTYPVQEFTSTASQSEQRITGWYLTFGQSILTSSTFETATPIGRDGDAIRVTPKLKASELRAQ